jgi:hypothetical protein
MKKPLDKVCYACYCLEIADHVINQYVKEVIRLLQAFDGVALGLNVNEPP